MNLTSQDSTVYWKRISIPKGLPALLETLVKEAIRENPENLVEFLSKLIDDLIAKHDQEQKGSDGAGGGGSGVGKSKGKSDEENPLLEKNKQQGQSYTKSNEEVAASKIQAGFRGYQTRKSLKSKKKGGRDLSLNSLTPVNSGEDENCTDEDSEKKRLEKAADEAIAAEIKTPLETIREESIDGTLFRVKSPEFEQKNELTEVDIPKLKSDIIEVIQEVIEEAEDTSHNISQELAKISNEAELVEQGDKEEKVEDSVEPEPSIVANVNELLNAQCFSVDSNNASVEEAGTSIEIQDTDVETLLESEIIKDDLNIHDKIEADEKEELNLKTESSNLENEHTLNSTDTELIKDFQEENQILRGEGISNYLCGDDISGQEEDKDKENNEIGEFNVAEDEIETAVMDVPEVVDEILEKAESEPHEIFGSLIKREKPEYHLDVKAITPLETEEIVENPPEHKNKEELENPPELEKNAELENSPELQSITSESEKTFEGQYPDSLEKSENSTETTPIPLEQEESTQKNEDIVLKSESPAKITSSNMTESIDDISHDSEPLQKSMSLIDGADDIAFIDDEKIISLTDEPAKRDMDSTPDDTNNISIDNVESPTYLPKSEHPSFAKTESTSSSITTVTVRPADLDKNQDSSQDASSLSETLPVPKPRIKQQVESVESNSSLNENENANNKRLEAETTAIAEESNEAISELKLSSEPPTPVLRRPKSSPKTRGRVVSSKYRSGIVMDDEISMEEMEAQIENEMMSQAATKIQAGYRGYKTRKSMRHSGVSFADDVSVSKKKVKSDKEEIPDAISADDDTTSNLPSGLALTLGASASADESLPSTSRKRRKPALGYLRSRSYPGSAEGKTPSIEESDDQELDEEPLPNVELDYDPAYVNNAATKIQASVRGFLVRKNIRRTKSLKNPSTSSSGNNKAAATGTVQQDPANELVINPADREDSVSPFSDVESEMAAAKIQAAFRGYKDRQKVRQTKKAVVTIQATVRGFLTRRRLLKLRRRSMQRRRSSAKSLAHEVQKMKKDNDAAIKIQSAYRGYQVRSKIRRNLNDE